MLTPQPELDDGESIVDLDRDVSEAFDADFNGEISKVPVNEFGIMEGTFKVTITWEPSQS